MRNRETASRAATLLALVTVALFTSCQPNQKVLKSSSTPVPEASLEPVKSTLATEIADMETAGLEQIFIIRRKDGSVFDKEDKEFLKNNIPNEINRRVLSDGGKAFVLGTNFIIPAELMAKWRERFDVQMRPPGDSGNSRKRQ